MATERITQLDAEAVDQATKDAVECFHTIYRLAIRSIDAQDASADQEDLETFLLAIRELAWAHGVKLDKIARMGLFGEERTEAANAES